MQREKCMEELNLVQRKEQNKTNTKTLTVLAGEGLEPSAGWLGGGPSVPVLDEG